MVLADAARRPGEKAESSHVSVGFLRADAAGKIAVLPPKYLDQGHLWYSLKAMNGAWAASKQWALKILKAKKKWGFLEVAPVPGPFYHPEIPEHDLMVCCHGDDLLASGEKEALAFLNKLMIKEYEVKVLPWIGPPEFGGECAEGKRLHRRIAWSRDGFM